MKSCSTFPQAYFFRIGVFCCRGCNTGHEGFGFWSSILILFCRASFDPSRKRHVGNDIIVLIYKESDAPVDPSIFQSQFNRMSSPPSKLLTLLFFPLAKSSLAFSTVCDFPKLEPVMAKVKKINVLRIKAVDLFIRRFTFLSIHDS